MNAWQEYKKKLGESRPWDLLDPNVSRATDEVVQKRLETCLSCDRLLPITKQCKECGCFMTAKTKLQNATCPLGKWQV